MKKAFLTKILLGAIVSLFSLKPVMASVDPPVVEILYGNLNQLVIGANAMVEDAKFFDPAYHEKLIKQYPGKGRVTFKINEAYPYFLKTAFSATITLDIAYFHSDSTESSENKSFTINYDPAQGYTHNVSYALQNVTRITISVDDTSSNASWDVWKALMLEVELQSFPAYHFNCTDDAVQTVSGAALPSNTNNDELAVNWPPVIGADEYDLEWTYVDSSAFDNELYGDTSSPDPSLIFRYNATRVTITGTSYNIPLMYDGKGVLFYRVRPVQWQVAGGRTEAHWSTDHLPAGLGKFRFNGHERKLNWQATTSYAEDGKRKVVVQYFDGSLRGRQTVTKDNFTSNTIVAESIYDYQAGL